MDTDIIFGDLDDAPERIARHAASRIGVQHRNHVEPVVPAPGYPVTLWLTTGGPLPFDMARCWYCCEKAEPNSSQAATQVIDLQPDMVSWDEVTWGYVHRWSAQLPAQTTGTLVRYRLAARVAGSERWIYADNQAEAEEDATEFAFQVWPAAPDWSREAIVYHIFVDRFYPGDGRAWQKPGDLAGFYGGTLRGVIDKLDYIESQGFNALWLSPVFASPSHHGYDATDLYQIEPRLGTNADLAELIRSAHNRGIRIILDFVANHWSHRHPTFQAALADQSSPYHDWYTWDRWPDTYRGYFGSRHMPELNLRPGPARDHLLDAARYWLEQGVDGFRLDYAYGPPHDFWAEFGQTCRATRPDCWLFGEVVHTPEVQATYAGRLDGALDFLLAKALRNTFGRGRWDLAELEAFLRAHEAYFPADFSRPAFLDNHDMNRFLFLTGDDPSRLLLAALVLFTLPGPPIVYYGTEAGITQERPIHDGEVGRFEEARLPMKWGTEQNTRLIETFRCLIALRRAHPVLRTGTRTVLHLDAGSGIYAYTRAANAGRFTPGDVLVALNTGPDPQHLDLPFGGPEAVADRLNGYQIHLTDGRLSLCLPPRRGAFIS